MAKYHHKNSGGFFMFKRILAFIMCAVTVLSMVGCGDDITLEQRADEDTRSDNAPITLSLYVPSLSKLTEETRLAVEEALNAISVKKYNTTLKFFAYPEEEYVPIVLSKVQTEMNSYVTYLWNNDEESRDIERAVDYTRYTSNLNLADMSDYPELAGAGIDIFVSFTASENSLIRQEYVDDPNNPDTPKANPYYNAHMADNMFLTMYYERVLTPITPRLINEYAVLKSKSYTEFFDAVTMPDMDAENVDLAKPYAYAMPNNYLLGSYQYLIINKDVVKEIYSQDYSTLAGNTARLEQLKKDLATLKDRGNAKLSNIKNVYVEFESYEEYMEFDESFALAMVKGDRALSDVIANPNYEIVKFSTSAYDKTEFATSMYCITRAYNPSLAGSNIDEDDRIMRCLDILLLIQNDVDFRNTLQYGVKGEHYTISRDGIVYTSSNDYVMDPAMTGNMFLLYPSDRMSPSMRKMAENNWRLAKAQNKEILDSKPAN